MQPLRTVAIDRFLKAKTHPDLAALYRPSMEVQVSVAQDDGETEEREYKGRTYTVYTDGMQSWKNFRIPHNAYSQPEYTDVPLSFDLVAHAEGIGMSGWDWENQESVFCGFDFDAITGHHAGLSTEELKIIEDRVRAIDYVHLRRSTSGNGLHLYVFFKPNTGQIETHTDHAAVSRAVLGRLSADVGLPLHTSVDVCGFILWQWHRKMKGEGLKLIKGHSATLDLPINWRDHRPVITRKSRRTLPDQIRTTERSLFEQLTGQHMRTSLDDEHQQFLDFLRESKYVAYWDADRWMLVTHSAALKEAHEALGCRGVYETVSEGHDPNTQNCFCFPRRGGAWTVRRFTPGVTEAGTWVQDASGWTTCDFNTKPTLAIASRAYSGIEAEKGHMIFYNFNDAVMAAASLGVSFDLPNWAQSREIRLKPHPKDNRLIIELDHRQDDRMQEMSTQGFYLDKKVWKRICKEAVNTQPQATDESVEDFLRNIVDQANEHAGWYVNVDDYWMLQPRTNVVDHLKALGYSPKEIPILLGRAVGTPWRLVSEPFEGEYPGDRRWNRRSAKLAVSPSADLENLSYAAWSSMLQHCGASLDSTVLEDDWCVENGVKTGEKYLELWIANLLQRPKEPLPYLFFHGPQNSGKSIFHEALGLIIEPGIVRADVALTSSSDFNGELESGVLCVIEEKELRSKAVANKIKDWVTSKNISIHRKGQTPYTVTNTTHWVQCNNDRDACPIFPGDTRITVSYVALLDEPIPKQEFLATLEKQAPDFLAAMLNLELPPPPERLNIPALTTPDKLQIEANNRTALEDFLSERAHIVRGATMLFSEFHTAFHNYLMEVGLVEEQKFWTKNRVARAWPSPYLKGKCSVTNQTILGNFSLTPSEPQGPEYYLSGNVLRQRDA